MKKITVRKVDWRIFIINIITVIVPLYFIISYAASMQNTTRQTIMIIGTLSVVGAVNFIIVKKGTYLVDVVLKDNKIEFEDKNKIIYSAEFNTIENYNIYGFINKRAGYVIRLNSRNGSFCSLFTWKDFNKATEADHCNYEELRQVLEEKMQGKKIMTVQDYLLRFVSATPYLFLGMALLLLIGIFIYFIFYI